jgi:hypothetical protein
MTNIMYRASLLFLVTSAACHKSPSGDPCEPGAVKTLAAQLADGSAKGKQYAFTGCKFASQGNDIVSFSDSSGGQSIDCKLKGGADAVTEFRHSAMKIGMSKLKIDVAGTAAANGNSVALADCDVTAHD